MYPTAHPAFTLRSGRREDIPALFRIWQSCFADPPEYIRFFLENRYRPEQNLVLLHHLEPVGALYLLPCRYIGYTCVDAWYGYALGILPQFRGLGLAKEMNLVVWNQVRERNQLYLLTPANEKLQTYYYSTRFEACSYRKTAIFTQRSGRGLSPQPISPAEYLRLREEMLSGLPHIYWDEAAIDFAIREAEFCGGFAVRLGNHACIGRLAGDTLVIQESTAPPDKAREFAADLLSVYPASTCVMSLPGTAEDALVGMSMEGCIPPGCYLNLILD